MRTIAPQNWILAPGIGAQGGDLAASLQAGLRPDGLGMIIPVSRAVIFAADPKTAAQNFRDQINAVRKGVLAGRKSAQQGTSNTDLILALHDAECVKFGNFTLASGKQSPIYVDLRRVISYPDLFGKVIAAYADLVRSFQYDRLAAVPYAALPAAAGLARRLQPTADLPAQGSQDARHRAGHRRCFPARAGRPGNRGRGHHRRQHPHCHPNAKRSSIGDQRRGSIGGSFAGQPAALAAEGLQLHAALTIDEIVDTLHAEKRISEEMYKTVKTYLEESHASS